MASLSSWDSPNLSNEGTECLCQPENGVVFPKAYLIVFSLIFRCLSSNVGLSKQKTNCEGIARERHHINIQGNQTI